ncbi:hypothetical protein J2Z21_009816 [Streptomyces griseochromogenes]|uniref:Uncharacterized protein n=1 Tax=Streptomyces griseochromogenes TaxID=68214 RepID=A0A1B1APW3_9ACTN|nr:hypothetical protein [Streptomyces griseochromogenes]ANP48575.1 hypothetical protein AVL59_02400 [Streptomyces griseochromogenes]ANP53683.1 hypothetical protein AVL59_32735 [Streptomyces griseochromogenes]MBP2056797.1 hypothetical protein [Streptomyces griseochromogenes]
MGRISEEARSRKEEAIRAATDRILRGELPPGGKCDLSTLATEAGVTRTAFYPKKNRDGTTRPGPYQHLAEEFERRLKLLQEAGAVVDPRIAQIQRLKDTNTQLEERIKKQNIEIDELKEFQQLALSRIAAQHLEIERLRTEAAAGGKVTVLTPRRSVSGTIGTCN